MPLPAKPLAERFWPKVDRRDEDECWLWNAGLDHAGYGTFMVHTPWGYRPMHAHRMAYLLKHRAVASNKWILHSCDEPRCCNPAHLRAGTPLDDANDRRARSGRFQRTAPLTDRDVREIRRRAETETQTALADEFGIAPGYVSRIVNRTRRKGVA